MVRDKQLFMLLSKEDRRLVEMVAAYRGETVEDYIRTAVLAAADEIIRQVGSASMKRELAERVDSGQVSRDRAEQIEQLLSDLAARDVGGGKSAEKSGKSGGE